MENTKFHHYITSLMLDTADGQPRHDSMDQPSSQPPSSQHQIQSPLQQPLSVNSQHQQTPLQNQPRTPQPRTPQPPTPTATLPPIPTQQQQQHAPPLPLPQQQLPATQPPPPAQGPNGSAPHPAKGSLSMDSQYMQQQSQIFVFTTNLANQAAEAVTSGGIQSIIAFHCNQPGTRAILEKHPLKVQQFNRQNNASWMSSLKAAGKGLKPMNPNMMHNMNPNSFPGGYMHDNMAPQPFQSFKPGPPMPGGPCGPPGNGPCNPNGPYPGPTGSWTDGPWPPQNFPPSHHGQPRRDHDHIDHQPPPHHQHQQSPQQHQQPRTPQPHTPTGQHPLTPPQHQHQQSFPPFKGGPQMPGPCGPPGGGPCNPNGPDHPGNWTDGPWPPQNLPGHQMGPNPRFPNQPQFNGPRGPGGNAMPFNVPNYPPNSSNNNFPPSCNNMMLSSSGMCKFNIKALPFLVSNRILFRH